MNTYCNYKQKDSLCSLDTNDFVCNLFQRANYKEQITKDY